MTRSTVLALLATMAALLSVRTADADMPNPITYTEGFNGVETNFSGSPLVTFSQFNPVYGTLNDVVFTLESASLVASGGVTNQGSGTQSFTISVTSLVFNLAPAAGAPSLLSNLPINPIAGNTVIGSRFFSDVLKNQEFNFGPFIDNVGTSTLGSYPIATYGAELDEFTGTGSYSFSPDVAANYTITGANNILVSDLNFASVSIEVSYYYTPVVIPEPPSLVLTGIAASLLGVHLAWARLRSWSRPAK